MRENDVIIIENFLDNKEQTLDVKEEPFEKLMFFYKSALNQLTTQMNIIKDEFQVKNYKINVPTEEATYLEKCRNILIEINASNVYDLKYSISKDIEKEYTYIPYKITEDIKEAVIDANIIFITLPSFASKKIILESQEYIKPKTWVGFYPGTGGIEFISKKLIEKGCIIFGTQRICSVVRLKEYGKYVVTELVSYIRPEKRFASVEDMLTQIKADCVYAKDVLQQ